MMFLQKTSYPESIKKINLSYYRIHMNTGHDFTTTEKPTF